MKAFYYSLSMTSLGFIMTLPVFLLLFHGCATVPIDQQLLEANQSITVVVQSTDQALNAHLITPQEAQAVSTIAHQVAPLLDSAKAANDAHNSSEASSTLTLINSLLAGLKAYVPPPESK